MSTNDYRAEYRRWTDSPALSEAQKNELAAISGDDKEIESRFFAPLDFGTAGLRGIMGVGLNRMNCHIIRHATQAFADVIKAGGADGAERGVVVCYDCRLNSAEFSREAVGVMAANGVRVRLFEGMRPTPELSFAIRKYGAMAGINITASHNPKEYNGYKVYWSDGAQLPPKQATSIKNRMDGIDVLTGASFMPYENALKTGLVELLGAETDEAFLEEVLGQSIDRDTVARVGDRLKIVYTPFHGAGRELVPQALKRLGVCSLYPVAEQMLPDGSFPTVKSPNPEDPEGFYLAIELAEKIGGDIIIGTDPDADRVGVMARNGEGEYTLISGNQMGVLLLDYIIGARERTGTMPENPAAIKTIVTTEMARVVAETHGVHMDETFTGFKFMAEKLAEYEKEGSYKCLLCYEESYGYMAGDFVRDKDAVTASVLIAEMAAYYLEKGMSLHEAMLSLYERYGWFEERTVSVVMPGVDGLRKMRGLMKALRETPPQKLADVEIARMRDYLSGQISVIGSGGAEQMELKGSDVICFELADGSRVLIRPSGTEPKIKIYTLVRAASQTECRDKIESIAKAAAELMA